MMNLAHWRLLVAIADTGNISRAAERVGITQSGASQAVTQLESALGIQIFSRSRREVTVTALGEQVVEHARAMLSHLTAIRNLADDSQGLNQGRIRLGSFPSLISTLLPPLLRNFQQRHPGIEIIALKATDIEIEDWLARDAIDVGVVLNPAAERHALIIGRDAWMALVPGSHPWGRRAMAQGVTLSELATQPFILATSGCTIDAQSLMENAGHALTDVRFTVRDPSTAHALVREGMGVALVLASTLPEDMRNLRALPVVPAIHREFGLVRSQAGQHSPAASALWGMIDSTIRATTIADAQSPETPYRHTSSP
ncbi:LysR family transcriptional regulator [Dyella caseinilytica]|uniref:LysR family transcriptional regulator n=1 Tax=Dyella caseinilytica TaxID=1849581 RepID=A0ABX7GWK7_9GAMM|nr:LysR family transcriptional regulator [Dyella caseinilytica]QRN53585.1 LysR family transcriptional regulator [Dyella caseinilytica]GFZ87674.1 LysR family transcriptional regulator [Dyella caseinilytica]